MRGMTALLLLALAVVATACGGSSEEGPGGLVVTPTATTTTRAGGRAAGRRAARGGRSCTEQGITTPPFNEGACVEGGASYFFADGRSVMRLRTLSASLAGFSAIESLGPNGEATPSQGVFVLIRLSVTNRSDRPRSFAAGQTVLVVGEQQFEERGDVERRMHRDALAFAGRDPIQPNERVIGDVVYDVPVDTIARVTREGTLVVVNFGGNRRGQRAEFGQFRIYRQ